MERVISIPALGDNFIYLHRYGNNNTLAVDPGDYASTAEALKKYKMTSVFSHRSRETEDTILSHLAIGFGSPFIKIGLTSGERTAKLNEIMRILK